MKKLTLSVLCLLMLSLCLPFCALADEPVLTTGSAKDYVVDNADLIFDLNEEELETQLRETSEKIGMDIVVVTTNTLDGKTPEAYADDYYDYNGYADDGCLFLVSTEDRDWQVSTKGYAITCITDYGIQVIEEECVHYLSTEDYYLAFNKYGKLVEEFYYEAQTGSPYDTNNKYTDEYGETIGAPEQKSTVKAIFISLVIALVIALIITFSVKSQYKPVKFNHSAAGYLVDGSLNVTQSYEHFLYSNVTKTQRQSSSGGGSSTHTSSSGSTHGGGGGKF